MKITKHNMKCFNEHMGNWMMHTPRLNSLHDLIMSENISFEDLPEVAAVDNMSTKEQDALLTPITAGGVMIIPIEGTIMRAQSSFGGTSSVQTRRILRDAVDNPKVKGIMLKIDSPGGTVAGTDELAADIKMVAGIKPIHAHVDGLMASAAFWTGAQASHITATRTSEIGSLGTVAVVHDMSKAAENEGIKVHVVSTGEFKGAFTPGSEVTEAHLANLQSTVDTLNGFFMSAVAEARGFDMTKTKSLFDGRTHLAANALEMGLIDGISGWLDAVKALENQVANDFDEEAELALARSRRR
jgi:signal peptide peptidase SppA